jgi:hypothetical protein
MKLYTIAVLLLFVIAPASAYSIPDEYKNTAMTDIDVYQLIINHTNESWAIRIYNEMMYPYGNPARFEAAMNYQLSFPRIVKNNMVQGGNSGSSYSVSAPAPVPAPIITIPTPIPTLAPIVIIEPISPPITLPDPTPIATPIPTHRRHHNDRDNEDDCDSEE